MKLTRGRVEISMNVNRTTFVPVVLKCVQTLLEAINATISNVPWDITMILRNQGE